ncbi:MAG: PE-PPE domain-containing protein [Gordonia paraffinivorans]
MGATALAMSVALTIGMGAGSALAETPPVTGGTILVLGGNSNPQGQDMEKELSGYFSGAPGTPYAGRTYRTVEWPAQTPFTAGWTGLTYDQSQQAGVSALEFAATGPHAPRGPLLVVGYSASAGVVVKTLATWQRIRDAGGTAPSPTDTTAIVFGNPNRPNGGIFARFPGLYAAPFGMTFDGPAPATDYTVLDISWEYDGVSDFPRDPSNGLALLNAAFGFLVHGSYKSVDLDDPSSIVQDVTVGTTRYVTVRGEYIPLLMPLRLLGVPTPILDAMEPGLRAQIEKAYDRSAGPGTPVPARIGPGQTPQAVVDRYVSTIGQAKQAVQSASPRHSASTTAPAPTSTTVTSTPATSTQTTSTATTSTSSTAPSTTPSTTTPSTTTPMAATATTASAH